MNVQITITAASGAEAREHMFALLNGGIGLNQKAPRVEEAVPPPAFEAVPEADAAEKPKAAEPAKRGRPKKEAVPNITATPEDRRPPEDDDASQAQDAADEAAEVEANRAPAAPLTVEDVMGEVGAYVEKFGMPAAQEDGPKIFIAALGAPPNNEPFWKKSLLATASQEQLQKARDAWKTAAAATKRFAAKGA